MGYDAFVKNLFRTVGRKYIGLVSEHVTMGISEDSTYSKKDRLAVLSYTGIAKCFVTSAAKRLKATNGKDLPSEETVLDSIRFVKSNEIFEGMKKANNEIIKNAVENKEFNYDVVAAMDVHDVSRYTKVGFDGSCRKRKCNDIKTVVGTKPKNGTCYAHKYMTIQNLKMDKEMPSYVLAFDRVLPLTDNTKIAETLIDEAESKINRPISLILGDGGFDDVDTMKMFFRKRKDFVVRADQDEKVKRVILEKTKKPDYHVEFDYVKGNKYNSVTVNLVIAKVKWLKKNGIKYPLVKNQDRCLAFFTNLRPRENETLGDFCLRIARLYKKRWGIETGYRDIKDFEGKTHSLVDSVRLFLYIQAILLYNIWVQINFMYKDDPDRIKYFKDGITKDFVRFIIEQAIIKNVSQEEKSSHEKYEGPPL